jgi:16S rRNA G1207 methylase RsmC
VAVQVPPYRGRAFLRVLSWLVFARLATPDATVSWHMSRNQGPDSIAGLLSDLGWQLRARERDRGGVRLVTRPPAPAQPVPVPVPTAFTATVGGQQLRLVADYGVFSPGAIDAGTAVLCDVALAGPAVDLLADIGTGYGAIAIALVRNGIAARAVGTDVDLVALWLARQNAAANDVELAVTGTPDPAALAPTALTVCNLPTHVDRSASAALIAGLCHRAGHGRLLMVVHASLEARYARHLHHAGLRVRRHPGPSHVVLTVTG